MLRQAEKPECDDECSNELDAHTPECCRRRGIVLRKAEPQGGE